MNNQPNHIPDSFQDWLADPQALPIGPKLDIVDAVNEFIRANPGKELPRDFFMAHMARVLNQPRSLDAIKDQDK